MIWSRNIIQNTCNLKFLVHFSDFIICCYLCFGWHFNSVTHCIFSPPRRSIPSLGKQCMLKTSNFLSFPICSNSTGGRGSPLATTTSVHMRHIILHHGGSTRMNYSACHSMRSSPWRQWWERAVSLISTHTAKVRWNKWANLHMMVCNGYKSLWNILIQQPLVRFVFHLSEAQWIVGTAADGCKCG